MERMKTGFLLGAATAAHQVEGNNTHSDFWQLEQMEHGGFAEPSGDAVDHYHRYAEDIGTLAAAGLNAYRFSLEWARIEPEEGRFCMEEVGHYPQRLQGGLESVSSAPSRKERGPGRAPSFHVTVSLSLFGPVLPAGPGPPGGSPLLPWR